jgi:hypothetical protein
MNLSLNSIDKLINSNYIDDHRICSGKDIIEFFKCFICLNLSFDPLHLKCCDSISCKNCIIHWTTTKNNSCPKCRKTNPVKETPGKLINNLYESIKIKCKFEPDGCKESFSAVQLNNHEMSCNYNKNNIKCEKCNQLIKSKNDSHDCVKELLNRISELSLSIKNNHKPNENEVLTLLSHSLKYIFNKI